MIKKELNKQKIFKAFKKIGALNNKKRYEIVMLLIEKQEVRVTQIYRELNFGQPAASHELRVLRNAGIIDSKRLGKEIHYLINEKNLDVLLECIEMLNK